MMVKQECGSDLPTRMRRVNGNGRQVKVFFYVVVVKIMFALS